MSSGTDMKKMATFLRYFLGLPIALIAMSVYAYSMAQEMNSDLEGNYNKTLFGATIPGAFAGLVNTLARMFDHYGDPTKKRNQIAGGISLSIEITQISMGILTVSNKFSPPVAITTMMNVPIQFLATFLNWVPTETWRESFHKNKGRYFGFLFGAASLACSSLSMVAGNKPEYFAGSACFDLLALSNSKNRNDDTFAPENKFKPLNKITMLLSAVVMAIAFIINLTASGLDFFAGKDIGLPIAFPSCMLQLCLALYLIAQADVPTCCTTVINNCSLFNRGRNRVVDPESGNILRPNPATPLLQ